MEDPRARVARVRAPAKLNLFLEVGGRRADGFHEIDSVLHEVTLHDEIEIEATGDGEIRLEEKGIAEAEKNLVYRAAAKLKESGLVRDSRKGARIRLEKRIPQGAGLGGGSSDAAATLRALARLWGAVEDPGALHRIAAELGSDVPFFLTGGTCRCRGRGEEVTSWNDAFSHEDPLHFVLVYPRVPVPTKLAYEALARSRGVDFALTPSSVLDSMHPTVARTRFGSGQLFFNRFESVVYPAFPELEGIHARLNEEPFLKVLMSGSGSTIYGVCKNADEASGLARKLGAELAADVYAVRTAPRSSPDLPSPHVRPRGGFPGNEE
jgi:4-diphosphocytidyl-2-C-methyl-D-erythritol kinase